MPNTTWDKEKYGDPADWNIDLERTEHEGFKVGQRVVVTQDGDEDAGEYYFEGDEGVVIGVAVTGPGSFNPSTKVELIVGWDDQDPTSVDPMHIEEH